MAKHALIIFNPAAKCQTNVEEWIDKITAKLEEHDEYVVASYPTTKETTAENLVQLAKPPLELIVAAGGDGTVRLVLGALAKAKSDTPVAIFPLGTANALARNLGIMQEELFADPLVHAFDCIFRGHPMKIDLAQMNGEYFASSAGVGPISDAFIKPDRAEKTSLKIIAYAKAMLATIAIRPRVFKITTGGRSFPVQASGVFINNVEDLGITGEVNLDGLSDGFLELHVLNPKGFKDYVELGFRYTGGTRDNPRSDYALRVKEVVVEVVSREGVRSAFQKAAKALWGDKHPSEPGVGENLPCMIDGEECGVTDMRVVVIPLAVTVLVPPVEDEVPERQI